MFPKSCKTCSLAVLDPGKRPHDRNLVLNVARVVGSHTHRFVADQARDFLIARTVALPPCGIGDAETVLRGTGADLPIALAIAQLMTDTGLHLFLARPWRTVVADGDQPISTADLAVG